MHGNARWMTRFAMFLVALCHGAVAGLVLADDTEVFHSAAAAGGAATVRPNVLFVLDTSSSMNQDVPGTGKNRLENMKDALIQILTEADNINVGLMRFHEKGGPVLFPVTYIDEEISEVEGESAGTIDVRPAAGDDDAEETDADGSVTVDSGTLVLGTAQAGGATATVSVRVSDGDDDVEESQNGDMYFTSTDLEFTEDGSRGAQVIGMRFRDVQIPQGAQIVSARLELTIDEDDRTPTDLTLFAHDTDDAPPFSTSRFNVSARPRTAGVALGNLPLASVGQTIQTPDFAAVIQQVVNRPGWRPGNAIALIVTGDGQRTVESYNGNRNAAPLLIVEYSTGGGAAGTQTVGLRFPAVDVPQGVTITSAYLEFTASTASGNDPLDLKIRGQAAETAAPFSASAHDISSRPLTTAAVAWNGVPVFAGAGSTYQSPSLVSVVQEIVDRADWCGGNAMALVLQTVAGTGSRSALSVNADPAAAPRLHIEFDPDSAGPGEGCIAQSLVRQVSTGNDDAEESLSNGAVNLGSSDLELTSDGSTNQIVGMRFQNVNIGPGAQIISATIEFTTDETDSGATTVLIQGEDVDDSAPFATTTGNLSSRSKTTAGVSWSPGPWNTVGEKHVTPDLSAIVQEIVNRPGWQAGNAMSFLVTGSGERTAESYNGDPAGSPKLTVRYIGGTGEGSSGTPTVRTKLIETVQQLQYKTGTPIVSSLLEATFYYRGDKVYYGRTRGRGYDLGDSVDVGGSLSRSEFTRVSHRGSYVGADPVRPSGCTAENLSASACVEEAIVDPDARYISPIQHTCQANYLVLLSDGQPSRSHAIDDGLLPDYIGLSNCSASGNAACGVELVSFLRNSDQIDDSILPGAQTVTTYTIGFNFAGEGFLQDLAAAGGGSFFTANTAEELADVFQAIIAEVLAKNTTFVAPAVTVNTFNRLTHRDELYFALFKPSNDTKWEGNLKRFKLASDGTILDANESPAVDAATGFFRDTARSFFGRPQDMPDGGEVTLGGAASLLGTDRKIYTNTDTADYTDIELNRADGANDFHESNAAITKDLLGIPAASDAERTALLQWARGLDVKDEDGDGDTSESRRSMGDPLHSEPVLVTYGGDAQNPDISIFLATNEGFLHAFDSDGTERFAFIPQELLPNLNAFFVDPGGITRVYGLDGPITVWIEGGDDGAVNAPGDHAYLYVAMRRGGNRIYSVDVTDRDRPKLRWVIDPDRDPAFSELGQTWSAPIKTRIKLDGVARDVLIFGGGYDESQDDAALPAADGVGRAIFIVDADTGALLWRAGPDAAADAQLPGMTNAIPADLRVIDLDSDGFADRIYAADTAGQILRFDLDPGNTGAANLSPRFGVIARLQGQTKEGNRRFFVAPDVALIRNTGRLNSSPYLSIAIGSGHRPHPLDTTIQDRFYVLRDPDVAVGKETLFDTIAARGAPITESDLQDLTDNVIGTGTAVDQSQALADLASASGFYVRLAGAGEKVLTTARTFNNRVIFATFTPGVVSNASCQASQGTARLYLIDVNTAEPKFDFDQDGVLETEDRSVALAQGGLPPNPVILFPDSGTGLPEEAFVCVGAECLDLDLTVSIIKTYWEDVE